MYTGNVESGYHLCDYQVIYEPPRNCLLFLMFAAHASLLHSYTSLLVCQLKLHYRSKYIADTRAVTMVDVHWSDNLVPGYRVAIVPPEMGLNHHYRGWQTDFPHELSDPKSRRHGPEYVRDRRVWDFLPSFLSSYNNMTEGIVQRDYEYVQ
jgi:hypothetical protein